MIDFNSAIAAIRDNNGFEPNKYDDSFYRLYNTSKGKIQVRISNHGTHLWTWVKNAPVNPSECLANICIVLSKDGTHNSSTTVRNGQWNGNENNPSNKPYDFEVVQYVYNCSSLSANNGNRINAFIQKIPQLCRYEDPLKNNSNKHAGVYSLKPNSAIQTIVTNSITSDPRQQVPQNISILQSGLPVATNRGMDGVDYPIEESKTRNDMKQNRIKLTESQLKRMVSKAVRNVLKENGLDAQESIYQIICNLEADIKTVISNTDSSSNQAFGDAQEKLNAITNSLSHIDANLAQQSHSTFAKLQEVISELQDIRISLKTLGAKDSYWGHPFKATNGTVGLSKYSR